MCHLRKNAKSNRDVFHDLLFFNSSKFDEVNDPYEGEGIDNQDYYRIACMTNSPKKMLLWSYYVNHRGCCVEFEIPEELERYIEKVKYVKFFQERTEMGTDEIIESLKNKGGEWEHENECRAIYYSPRMKNSSFWVEKDQSSNIFLRLPVKKICFGINAHKDESYIDTIKYILEYNKKTGRNVEIHKVKKATNKYELIDDKQFDVNAELIKYNKP